jgi:hypothetical protein
MKTLALALGLSLAAVGCAGQPLPQKFLTKAAHVLSTAQDIQQRSLKVYNAICAGRQDSVECAFIEQKIESAFGITLDELFADYDELNKIAKEAQQ